MPGSRSRPLRCLSMLRTMNVTKSWSTLGVVAVSTTTVKVPWFSCTVAGALRLYGADWSTSAMVTWDVIVRTQQSGVEYGLGNSSSIEPFSVRSTSGVVQHGDA